ncbi:MAG: hypothetical protein P9X24_19855 [Candidatus Hatepunaea meridiana]|nr:hypothetical protein [Candidatus Hatepunaea meridiana]
MKTSTNYIIAVVLLLTLCMMNVSSAYQIQLRFLSDNPMLFPIGPFIPGDLSNASDINFEDFEAFFEMYVEQEEADSSAPDELTLLVRLQNEDNIVFTVSSLSFDISPLIGRWLNNQELNYVPNIHIGQGEDVNYNSIMPYINGGNIRQGFYIMTLVISEHNDWETAYDQNWGIVSKTVQVFNPSQVDIYEPLDEESVDQNPFFEFSFPIQSGVVLHLNLAVTDENTSHEDGFELINENNIYASVDLPITEQHYGSNVFSFSYADLAGVQPLDLFRTYFWQITAGAPSMFPNEMESIHSPIYTFLCTSIGEGAGIGAGIGVEGGDEEGFGGQAQEFLGGNQEENPPPEDEAPVFNVLRNSLNINQMETINSSVGDLSQWDLKNIVVNGNRISSAELAQFLSNGNIRITNITISE